MVDVGLDNKGIPPLFFHCFGNDAVSFIDDPMTDGFDRFGIEQTNVVANASGVEVETLLPIPMIWRSARCCSARSWSLS